MIYPIVAYGDPVLKQRAREIDHDFPDLRQLADDMFETMYASSGVGLAGPQIGKDLRIFVVDAEPMDEEKLKGFKKVFINPQMLEELGTPWPYEEGCLSIPGIREDVSRPGHIRIRYRDLDWQLHEETYDGMAARVIQHEYDHLEGRLFTDHLSAFRRRLLRGKLQDISRGRVDVDYRMRFPKR